MQPVPSFGTRPCATAFFASTLFLAAGASADIAEINGSVQLDARTQASAGGFFTNAHDRFNANFDTDPRFDLEPQSGSAAYNHNTSLNGAFAAQDVTASASYDASTAAFSFDASGGVSALTAGERGEASADFNASFSVEAATDTFVDVTITLDYTPGVNMEGAFASIRVDGVDGLDTSFFKLHGQSEAFFATLSFRAMIEEGNELSISADAQYDLFAQGDEGFDASEGLGFLGLSASVAVAPSPAPIAMLGLGSLAAARRRR